MAIKNKFIHFNTRAGFDANMPNPTDTTHDFYNYTVFIKDTKEIYTHGQFYNCNGMSSELLETVNTLVAEVAENEEVVARALSDLNANKASRGEIPTKVSQLTNDADYATGDELSTIANSKQDKLISGTNLRTIEGHSLLGSGNISVCVQSDWNTTDSNSKAYIKNKPTIPSAVTESTVEGWGFTKNSGTYTKPSTGIPMSDLATIVQTSLGKADSAVQPDQISNFVSATDLAKVATSGSYNDLLDVPDVLTTEDVSPVCYTGNYNDLNNKPTIPDAVTESTVSGWGFTKNIGTVTNIKINGTTINPSKGVIDLGTVLTSYTPMNLSTADTAPLSLRWSPNQKYAYTGATTSSGTVTFTMDLSSINAQKDNTWCLSFITGSTVPTINFGVGQTGYTIMWANGVAPTFEANTFYEISFKLVGTYLLGVCGVFKTV